MSALKRTARSGNTRSTVHAFGWKPDLPDGRDLLYGAVYRVPRKLPSSVNLCAMCSPVEDQSQLGSCTGNALAGALEFLIKKHNKPHVDLSRLFIYYNERVLEHDVSLDNGATIRNGVKTLVKQGVCPEASWQYVISKFAVKPPAKCYKEALKYRVSSYQRIETLDQMRACLADGFPFVFGFSVYDYFESQQMAKTGKLLMPKKSEKMLGGHTILAVGYDDRTKRLLVRNSWGTDWGKKGYFTMPYDYAADRNLADDFWTIRQSDGL